jgi:WD40 repeat protein
MRWEAATGVAALALPEQLGSRTKWVAYDKECRRAAVLLFDSSVSVWDLQTQQCVSQLIKRGERDASRVHSGGVNAVYLTDAGDVAVTVSKDCTARVWDLEKNCCAHVLQVRVGEGQGWVGLLAQQLDPTWGLLAAVAAA